MRCMFTTNHLLLRETLISERAFKFLLLSWQILMMLAGNIELEIICFEARNIFTAPRLA